MTATDNLHEVKGEVVANIKRGCKEIVTIDM